MLTPAVGFEARAAAADLVVTGEGRLDWQSLHGKVTPPWRRPRSRSGPR